MPASSPLPRRRRIRLPLIAYRVGFLFHVTIATSARRPWFAEAPALMLEAEETLRDLAATRGSLVFAWCFMPDHVHLLVADQDLVAFVRRFKGQVVTRARRLGIPDRWQRSFHDRALRADEAVERVALYIWLNPVTAGLVPNADLYPGSGSLAWPSWRDAVRAAA